jgi:hypothetical protein
MSATNAISSSSTPTAALDEDQSTSLSSLLSLLSLTLPAPYPRRILPIPPAPTVFDEFVIDVGPIGQQNIDNGVRVLVLPVSLDRNVFAEGEVRSGVLGAACRALP